MKVVLFCGGMGMRLREYSESIPKPMVMIGYRPILWNVMKYYAHYGHKDFILCLGYKGDMIKDYFINYNEYVSNDFVFSDGGKGLKLLSSDIQDWKITFVDTGLTSNIGQRLKAVQPYLEGEDVFLANYSDGLTDLHLPDMIAHFYSKNKVASFMAYQSTQSIHVVTLADNDCVNNIMPIGSSGLLINCGYFIFKKDIFRYIGKGEELVEKPFQRLIEVNQLAAYRHKGFWSPMDTFKDKQQLDDMHAKGNKPWEVWKKPDNAYLENLQIIPTDAAIKS
jgi:glucose-1-phosphate cytidylyltransferase